jgi:hypothetical protein
VLFVAMIKPLGFIVSAGLFAFAVMVVFERKPVRSLVFSVCVASVLYLMKAIYHFYVPTGIFNI